MEEADAVLVTPVKHTGTPSICPLKGMPPRDPDGGGEEAREEVPVDPSLGEFGPSEDEEDDDATYGGEATDGGEATEATEATDVEGTDGSTVPPWFEYQRRKFVLKDVEGGGGGSGADGDGDKTFGLVDLPVSWPLRR